MNIYEKNLSQLKKHFLPLSLFSIGLGCHIIFWFIGSRVESDGTLIEPFFLLPFGYFFYSVGIFLGITKIFWAK